jgi:GH15 family glucan-1,4-alpha-glucosidase
VSEGQSVTFDLAYTGSYCGSPAGPIDVDAALRDTAAGWHSWMEAHQGYQGLYREEVWRSAIVLQGLTYQPSGAVVAAPTTSLPEIMGGTWNWDYRYAWLRDASLVMNALWVGACPDEPERFFSWIDRCGRGPGREEVQIMFGVEGERDLTEHFLENLGGFGSSRPVRIGNDAWKQKQLDVLGEVLDAAWMLREKLNPMAETTRSFLASLAERASTSWLEPDRGMWELRDRERHYLSSKLMCWVALDRAVKLGLGVPDEERQRWAAYRDEIRSAILDQGWSSKAGAFTGAFGSDVLDASVLLMPITGFLSAKEPRMKATIEAIDKGLGEDGLIRRFPGEPGGFVLCSYWMAQCLALAGEQGRARERFESVTARANDLGLLSEEIDPATSSMLGNFPQAFSHIGLINTAWSLTVAEA